MTRPSRRDFLKLGPFLSGAIAATGLGLQPSSPVSNSAVSVPNILIFVFDAMSATNLSLYGYRRKTTPNLERFAAGATVYNEHYSTANFTTPGTASLLTGLHPWTHHAINESGLIARSEVEHNLFRTLGKKYYRLAFSQNIWPNFFFGQFQHDIEKVPSASSLGFVDPVIGGEVGGNLADSYRAFDDFLFQDSHPPASLVFGLAERIYELAAHTPDKDYLNGFPLGNLFHGLTMTLETLRAPWLAYLHVWPPHSPYRPSNDFRGLFADGWNQVPKSTHRLVDPHTHHSQQVLNSLRQTYDEYVANLDAEFGKMIDSLEARGILDQSYVVVTSDHGEFFERGEQGHLTPLLYDPVVRVPLLISSPGQRSRQDVNVPTSSVDVLPTLVHISGGEVPTWCQGQILPAFGGAEDMHRSIFMMEAKLNKAVGPWTNASFAMRKGEYKLIYYKGFQQYNGRDRFELYNMRDDVEELENLYSGTSALAGALRAELLGKIDEENSKFHQVD